MSELRVLRSLVTQSLSAAAQQILEFVERMLLTSEMSPEQQLSAAADEILKILENWMDRLLLSAPSEQQRCEQCRSSSPSVRPQFKDAATETDAELIHGKPSHLHQTQNTEKSSATSLEAETPGERCGAPSSDSEIPSSANPKAVSEGVFQESLKSNKRRSCRRLRQNQDCSKACERSSHKDAAEQKMNISPANKNQTTGQSCCRVCGKFFWYKRSFLKHVLKHEQVADLCGVCGKRLASVESLKVHLQAHNEENSCRDKTDEGQSSSECSDTENKVSDSDEDWKESDSSRDGDNDETNKSNARKRAKKKHHKDVSHLKYCCKVCGKTFCYRASFLKHVQEEERDTDVCGVCGKRFESEQRLRLHMQTYIRTNDCEVCGKHFEGLKQLEMHMRTHTGEKPYVCSFCGKAFAQNGNLIGHMRVHTGEKPYACSVCGQSFSFKEYMMAHMRIHTGEKPFLCSVCGKGFRQRGTLKTHMMIHTGESTHRCLICDKTFYKSGALKIHMRSHTGEKPYLCNVCGKRFPAGSSLTKHMGVHEGRRAHCCSVCGEGCLRKEDLRKHLQTHRNESTQLISL